MEAIIAGVKKQIEEGTTITKLIQQEKVENAEYVTVTLNDDFLEKAVFESTVIKEGDNIEFLYFMGGGSF